MSPQAVGTRTCRSRSGPNEEVLAINEELQSANEELETSKEELQSINEELVTVNNQLSEKVEELSEVNDDLANFLNSSEVATLFLDRGFCIRRYTPSATRLMSLMPVDIGRPISHISNQFIDVNLPAVAEDVLRDLRPHEQEIAAANGSYLMMRCVPYRTSGNLIDCVVFTFTDVTRLKQSEQAMFNARRDAENIISTIHTSLVVLDPELRVAGVNRAFRETFQVSPSETTGCLIYDLGNGQWNIPQLRGLLEGVLKRDTYVEDFEVEHDFPHIGHKVMSVNARKMVEGNHGGTRSILLAIDDVTSRRQAEAERHWLENELRQAQKMESIGTLAAGIAHDFNNNLNIVQGYAVVLRDRAAQDDLVAESVDAILEATKRSATIVQQLLTLARKTEPKLETLQIEPWIDELAHLVRQTFPKTIEVQVELSHDLPPVVADRNQLSQALLNICVNARDAMPEGGRLTIKASRVNANEIPDSEELTAQHYVVIEITDTGVGMDENTASRIFEPFFTTKGTGRGTGLGLAVVYGIVQHHKGFIQVHSKPMHGSSFKVYLPGAPIDTYPAPLA